MTMVDVESFRSSGETNAKERFKAVGDTCDGGVKGNWIRGCGGGHCEWWNLIDRRFSLSACFNLVGARRKSDRWNEEDAFPRVGLSSSIA